MSLRMSGLVSGFDTEGMVKELMTAEKLKSTRIKNNITKLEWKQEKWKALNTKIYSFYTDTLSKMRMQNSYSTKKVSSSDESVATVTTSNTAPEGTHQLQVGQLASAQFETGNKLGLDINSKAITGSTKLVDLGMASGAGEQITVDAGGTSKTLTITDTTTVSDFLTTLKDAGLNASYDTTQKRFFISTKESGLQKAFSLVKTGTADLNKLGLTNITKTLNGDGTVNSVNGGVNLIKPADAIFKYNGVEMTGSSNNVSVNGLNFSLKSVTSNYGTGVNEEVVSLNVKKDTQAVYDMVKAFVKSYNELLKEMNTDYNADTAKGYDPLTDEQKEAMTDEEVKKWEDKIKNSLLRRDDNVGTLTSLMRFKLSESVTVDGKKYALSSFGIKTNDYKEKGLLHIDGDKDETDSAISTNENKLMTALTNDPDTVMDALTQLAKGLYTSMTDKMKSSSIRSSLHFYNDKELEKTLKDYKTTLAKEEDRLETLENKYYKQFSAMESALSKINSESSSLSSLLGTN